MFFITKKGFTLVELTVTAAILGIIACIALPAYHRYMAQQEMNITAPKLTAISRHAKNLAVIQNSNIVICPSENLTQCQSDKWSSGVIMFNDSNKNRQIDSGEQILQSESFNLKYSTLDWRGGLSFPSLTFQAISGLPIGSNGSFYHCSLTALPHKKIIMSKMGHFRVENPASC